MHSFTLFHMLFLPTVTEGMIMATLIPMVTVTGTMIILMTCPLGFGYWQESLLSCVWRNLFAL